MGIIFVCFDLIEIIKKKNLLVQGQQWMFRSVSRLLHIPTSFPILFRMSTKQQWTVESALPGDIKALVATAASKPRFNYVLVFLQIVSLLKKQRRTGWVDHDIEQCESISDHMYRMSIASMLITDKSIDTNKCVKIAAIHDIAESVVGDITPFDEVDKMEKHRRELVTIEFLSDLIKKYDTRVGEEILQYWLDYEEIRTPEARYVKDIDKFEMLLQSFEYEKQFKGEKRLDQFWGARSSIKTDEVKSWTDELWEQRQAFWKQYE